MNELTIINEQEVLGKQFKIYGDFENPLFLAKDVAKWIDYGKNTGEMLKTVDEDEKLTTTISYSGQNRNMWFLTEDFIPAKLGGMNMHENVQGYHNNPNLIKRKAKVTKTDLRKKTQSYFAVELRYM